VYIFPHLDAWVEGLRNGYPVDASIPKMIDYFNSLLPVSTYPFEQKHLKSIPAKYGKQAARVEYMPEAGSGRWVTYIAAGWWCLESEVPHTIHETRKDALTRLAETLPCDCEDCSRDAQRKGR
jgi:hypothetical protein